MIQCTQTKRYCGACRVIRHNEAVEYYAAITRLQSVINELGLIRTLLPIRTPLNQIHKLSNHESIQLLILSTSVEVTSQTTN